MKKKEPIISHRSYEFSRANQIRHPWNLQYQTVEDERGRIVLAIFVIVIDQKVEPG